MALFQPLDLSCPFSTVLFRRGSDVLTSVDLKVADDQAWTLKEDVRLFAADGVAALEDVLVWCADGTHEVLRISWERAKGAIDASGLIPAGTSLLSLLARL
jgi:hypothetical protein